MIDNESITRQELVEEKQMRLSIKLKLFMVIISILLIFVTGFLVVMEFFMDDMYRSKYEDVLGEFYESFAKDYEKAFDKAAYLRDQEKDVKGFITIFIEDYSILESTSPDLRYRRVVPDHIQMDSIILKDLDVKAYNIYNHYEEQLEIEMMFLVGRVSDHEFILIEKSLSEVEQASEIVKNILMMTILSVLIIGFVIAYFASYFVTKPIVKIKNAVTKIAGFDFNHQLNIKNKDEIGDLGHTINIISEELKSKIDEIHEKNRLLDEDKTQLEELNCQLLVMSKTDHLTNLSNRLEIDRILDYEENRMSVQGSTFSVILIDIDHFKRVNDTYGHPIGDKVLIQISEVMKELSRRLDTVGRWGGEEFIIVLPDTLLADALIKAEYIRKTISETDFEKVGRLTVSMGVTQHHEEMKMNHMINLVDQALYQAKENGRNRVESVK